MPIPSVNSGETQDEFVSRCIGEIFDEYGQTQSAAICYSKWREERMSKASVESKIADKIAQFKKYEGIDLRKVDLIEPNPCWEGYEAIGTKIVDGREVPNCVPIQD
jgi:hypothetical protein